MQNTSETQRTEMAMVLCGILLTFSSLAGAEEARDSTGEARDLNMSAEAAPTSSRDDHIRSLESLSASDRVDAARALGELRDPAAVPALTRALRSDPNPVVRGWIVRALHQINTIEARTAITIAAQRDADERVRSLAIQLVPEARPTPPSQQAPAMYAPVVTQSQVRTQQRRPGSRFRVPGWILLAGTYGITLLMSLPIEPEETWPNVIPVVGPAVTGTMVLRDDFAPVILGIFGWLSTAIQITGLALAITGHVQGRRSREEQGGNLSYTITPTVGPDGQIGLTARGRF